MSLMRLSENIRKVTLPMHGLFILGLVWLSSSHEWSRLLWAIPIWAVISGLGIAIGYHRLLSHRAFETSTFIRRALGLIGVYAGQGSPVFWIATHRGLHHPFSDQAQDPHSPEHGLFHAFIGWQLDFDRTRFSPRMAVDILRDPFLKLISIHYHKVFWSLPLLVALFDWRFALGSLVPAMILSTHQENFVNMLCHIEGLGYRNFETPDKSNNIWILGILFWGQALHNNHHRHPKRWNFATERFEFDPCSLIVPLLIRHSNRAPEVVAAPQGTQPSDSPQGSAKKSQHSA